MFSNRSGFQLLLALLLSLGYIQGLSCPEGEHQYTCFVCVSFFSDVLLDYASARQLCQSRQGDLVNVDDSWQAEVIRRYLEGLNESRGAWIGEYYLNNTNCYTASSDAGNWKSAPCAQRRPVVCAKTYGSPTQLAARAGGQVLVANGQMLKLNANISGLSLIKLKWTHDSFAAVSGSVASTNDTTVLTIQSVNVTSDLGWYRLIVRDPATTYVLAVWKVIRARIESFAVHPKSMNVSVGGIAVFQCLPVTTTTLPTATIVWYKDNAPLVAFARIYVSNFTGTLMISNVTTADGGVYFCKASNVAGTITSQNATLTITNQTSSLQQTAFLLQPKNTTVLSGNPFTLECVPPYVKSSHTLIFTTDYKLVTVLRDSVFPMYTVQSAALTDSNSYGCVQLIPAVLSLYSEIATVQVENVPQIDTIVVTLNETIVSEASVVSLPRGALIRVVCTYTSIPPPTLVAWLVEGMEVTTGVNTSASQTVLEVTYFDTPGMLYQCLVSNVHGHSITGVSICIKDMDSLLGNVNFSVLANSQTQLLVQWTPPTATPTIDPLLFLYEVVFATPTSPSGSSGMLDSDKKDYIITGLAPGTMYNVAVLAHSVSTSSGAIWSTAYTYGNVPLRAVSGLVITLINTTSVQVSWDLLVTTPPEQPISSYIVTYYSDNESSNISVTLSSSVASYVITNITAGIAFQVCIGYIAQVQRSPARFVVGTVATCANMTPSLGNIGLVVPRPSQGAPVNGVLLAIVITVVIVIVIGVLVTVVLTGLVCQRNNGGRYSPARAEKGKEERLNPDRQRPMGQQVFDLAPTLSMLDEAFNSLSVTMDIGVVSPKPTELAMQQQNRLAVTPSKDEEML